MSLFSEQLRIDAENTLLYGEEAQDITRQIAGDPDQLETIRGIVDWDCEVDGAARRPSGPNASPVSGKGVRAPRHCVVELLATQEVLLDDRYVIEGALANVIRVTGRDQGMQSVLCVVPGGVTSKSSRARP